MSEDVVSSKHQFSSVPRPIGSSGGREGRFSRDLLRVFFSAGGPCEQFWHGQGCSLVDVVHPAFPLPTTASPTLQGALKDGFGEAVVACGSTTRRVLILWPVRELRTQAAIWCQIVPSLFNVRAKK